MDQPHTPIDDVLQQVENYRLRREVRDGRPDRITEFIHEVAELFEPIHGVGRVGFRCEVAPVGWAISMYLGATEVVGGRDDGQLCNPGFYFDTDAAIALFSSVDSVQFASQPQVNAESESGLVITGQVDLYPIRLAIHSIPPEDTVAGMQRMPDRTLRLT